MIINVNVFGLCVRVGFGAQNCQPALNLIRSTKVQVCKPPRLTQNPCYRQSCLDVSLLFSVSYLIPIRDIPESTLFLFLNYSIDKPCLLLILFEPFYYFLPPCKTMLSNLSDNFFLLNYKYYSLHC